MNLFETYHLRRVINAAGTMTYLGSSRVSSMVGEAMASVLPEFVEMRELQRAACRTIAQATGAEGGCVTASAASGISVAVAACMTGSDLFRIEQLPGTQGLKNEIIVQKGHSVGFGASLSQTVRLTGADCVEIGTATHCAGYQLRGAIGPSTAALLYVVSHHTVQSGMLSLKEWCAIAQESGIPVIVDAASEYDLTGFLQAGADLVIYSGHKFLGGPTSGIIAGKLNLVRSCYMQEKGIGRGMKVGKESIVGVMAALEQWMKRDAVGIRAAEEKIIDYAYSRLNQLTGIRAERVADPTRNPITRLRVEVDRSAARLSAFELSQQLAAGNPTVRVRSHEVDLGHFQIDPCNLLPGEIEVVCSCIEHILANPAKVETVTENQADLGLISQLRWPD